MTGPRKPGLFRRLTDALFEDVEPQPAPRAPRPAHSPSPTVGARADKPADDEIHSIPIESDGALDAAWAALTDDDTDDGGPTIFPHDPVELSRSHVLFNHRLDELIASGAKAAAGKLQLINFDEIRAKLGDRWPAMADKARHITEQVIAKRLAASDVSAPMGDGYIILFAELTEEQARLKATAIGREVRERLLGELDLGDRDWVNAFIGEVTTLTPTEGEAKPSLANINRALAQTTNVLPSAVGVTISAAELELQRRVGEVGVSYRPTVLPGKGVVSVYDARVQRLDDLNRVLSGAAAYHRGDDAITFEIDRAVLSRATQDLRTMALDSPALVLVPLHIRSFTAHSFGKLLDLCRELPPGLRRYLVIDLIGLGHNASTTMLATAVNAIQPFTRALAARILPSFTDLDRLARLRFSSVGFDLEDPEIGELTPALFTDQIRPLVAKARAVKLQSYLYGLKRREIAKAAADAGFDYLNGPAVMNEVPKPLGLQSIKRSS